jgi:hypothetical protein
MNKKIAASAVIIVIVAASIAAWLVNNQISELQSQNSDLQKQLNELQEQLRNLKNSIEGVRILAFDWTSDSSSPTSRTDFRGSKRARESRRTEKTQVSEVAAVIDYGKLHEEFKQLLINRSCFSSGDVKINEWSGDLASQLVKIVKKMEVKK